MQIIAESWDPNFGTPYDIFSLPTGNKRIQLEEDLFVEVHSLLIKFTNMLGVDHNPYGPSYLYSPDLNEIRVHGYLSNKHTILVHYEIQGEYHRLNGPACFYCNPMSPEVSYSQFWIDGNKYESELDYWIAVGKYKKENGIE